jgi:hypothetical protein
MRLTVLLLLHIFFASRTCLPCLCLAKKGGMQFTEPLPSNDKSNTHTDTQTDGRDLRSALLRCAQVPWYILKFFLHRPWRPFRIARNWGSHIYKHSAHRWRQGCQPYAPAAIYPQEDSWYLFLLRSWVDPRTVVQLEELGKVKQSTSSGSRTGDLPAFSIVPQPTTLPRAPCHDICTKFHKD